jgi:small subunit ribosomal protein S7
LFFSIQGFFFCLIGLTRIAKGGTLYSVPIPMSPIRGTYTAIRLLIDSTHDARPHDQRFWTLFAKEIMDAAQNQGRTIKKKQEIHRNAELNRAYAHFKWQK